MKQLAARRSGFTLIEILVVVIILGILASVSLANFTHAQDKSRNAAVVTNMETFAIGLEAFASDNNGSYPAPGSELLPVGGLTQNQYLPGNTVTHSPWSATKQANSMSALCNTPPEMESALAYATAQPAPMPTFPTIMVGANGHTPSSSTFDIYTFGALLYDFTAPTSTYVLYGIGKDGVKATMIHDRSNQGN